MGLETSWDYITARNSSKTYCLFDVRFYQKYYTVHDQLNKMTFNCWSEKHKQIFTDHALYETYPLQICLSAWREGAKQVNIFALTRGLTAHDWIFQDRSGFVVLLSLSRRKFSNTWTCESLFTLRTNICDHFWFTPFFTYFIYTTGSSSSRY